MRPNQDRFRIGVDLGSGRVKIQADFSINHIQGENMFVAVGRFIACRVEAHRKHPVSTDGGTRYPRYAGS